ncbi:MAG: hypothetical protein HY313_08095 [Acidobacteria bacterium]|nr:hypothetical protein [Acidobacteriota bacterium]
MKRRNSILAKMISFLFAIVFAMALHPRAIAEDVSAATALEAALEKDPDNLRLGSEYRQLIIRTSQYDRALKFFEKLVQEHDNAASAHLNYAFAYVDKIPIAGSITQVLLANSALAQFSRSLELGPSWIGYYSRGNSYLYWPKIFGRTPLGIDDLKEAMRLQRGESKKAYYVRTYIALGDGYWKMDELNKAKAIWNEGLSLFPGNPALKARLSTQGDELKAVMDDAYDITKRIDTSLQELWADQGTQGR